MVLRAVVWGAPEKLLRLAGLYRSTGGLEAPCGFKPSTLADAAPSLPGDSSSLGSNMLESGALAKEECIPPEPARRPTLAIAMPQLGSIANGRGCPGPATTARRCGGRPRSNGDLPGRSWRVSLRSCSWCRGNTVDGPPVRAISAQRSAPTDETHTMAWTPTPDEFEGSTRQSATGVERSVVRLRRHADEAQDPRSRVLAAPNGPALVGWSGDA